MLSPPGLAIGARRQPGYAIGIVAGSPLELGLEDAAAERLALGDRVDDGRVGLELHSDPQPVAIDAGDQPPLGRLAGLLLDDGGE